MARFKLSADMAYEPTAPHNQESLAVLLRNFAKKGMREYLTIDECTEGMDHQPPVSVRTGDQVDDNRRFIWYLAGSKIMFLWREDL